MIYVASSWKNQYYPEVVARLREAGHEVYDFRNPPHDGNGFRWTDIDENARIGRLPSMKRDYLIRLPNVSLRPIWRPWRAQALASSFCLAVAAHIRKPDGWPVQGNAS